MARRNCYEILATLALIVAGLLATNTLGQHSQPAGSGQRPGMSRSPVAPTHEQIQAAINEAYAKFNGDTSGKNADYIAYLAQVDSKLFGIAAVSTDGRVFVAGDVNYPFSIQSISEVFTLALAMNELGPDKVLVEELSTHTGNPFVNAGAVATTSLIAAADENGRWNKILQFYSAAAGEKLKLIDDVYQSKQAANIYAKQCSVGVTARQLAVMGATLANNGVNPITREHAIQPASIPRVLALMSMAGLADGSGGWAWKVGLPAKSGVGGGILAVVPGKGAIVGFAPRLDQAGNSVKAQKAIAYIADRLDINLYSPASVGLK